jgi:glycosyltransferase involved in cell wall biosynthesis
LLAAYSSAHFLLLPTRAEAFGNVFSEASAFGVPSVATRTGGVPTAVLEGVNGHLVDPSDAGGGYADHIERLWRDQSAYTALSERARTRFESTLNWDTWGSTTASIIRNAVESRASLAS